VRFQSLLLAVALTGAAQAAEQVIIDTDPGTDDAMAILLALNSPELEVRALTVVHGNVPLRQGIQNALKLAALAGRCDLPVAAGASRPLVGENRTAESVHGENGLGNVELDVRPCPIDPRFGPDRIIEMVHNQPGELTLVPIGPLTNIALAVLKDPSIVPLVKEVVLMGGAVSGGNATAVAEFNIWGDPEAAQIVFRADWPLTMVGLDVTEKTVFTPAHLDQLGPRRGPQTDFVAQVFAFMFERMKKYGRSGMSMHDPLAVGYVIDRSLLHTQCFPVEVETDGKLTRGATVADRRRREPAERCAHVGLEVAADRFLRLFTTRLQGK